MSVPGAPGSFKATAGVGQVTLSWTAPADDGGSTILGYKVWYGNVTPVTLDAKATQYTFKSLKNGQSYTFKIVAVSAKGDSAEMSATATPTASNVPNPSGGNTSNTGNTSTGIVTGSLKPTYTVITPKDKPAVTDKNGNTTSARRRRDCDQGRDED